MAEAAEPVRRGFPLAEKHDLLACDISAPPIVDRPSCAVTSKPVSC